MKRLVLALICFASLAACKTAQTGEGGDGPSRRMMGANDKPLTAEWKQWTPSSTLSTPATLAEQSTAFDYWQVTDAVYLEEAWAAMFGILAEVRRVVPKDYIPTFRMLMTVLEPGMQEGTQHLDATFFAAQRGTSPMFEGVAWRMWRELPSGATPGVTVWMRRPEGSAELPSEATVWFYGGFEEARSVTLTLRGRPDWTLALSEGVSTQAERAIEGESALIQAILVETFWRPVIGSEYLETAIEKRETTAATPVQHPVALGLALGDRDIDQVFSDSVFAPRLTIFPTKRQ